MPDFDDDKKNPLAGAHPDAVSHLRDLLAKVIEKQTGKRPPEPPAPAPKRKR